MGKHGKKSRPKGMNKTAVLLKQFNKKQLSNVHTCKLSGFLWNW